MIECMSTDQLNSFLSMLSIGVDYYHQLIVVHATKTTVIYEQVSSNLWCIAEGLKS